MVLILFCISVITFVLSRVVPADPAAFVAGMGATQSQVESIRKEMGLDKPLVVQYKDYMTGILHLDFGKSIRTRRSVSSDLKVFVPATLELNIISFAVYLVVAISLGLLAAVRRGGIVDLVVRFFATAGSGAPVFWLAMMLQLLFFAKLGWLPVGGRIGTRQMPPPHLTGFFTVDSLAAGDFSLFLSVLKHLILPVVTIVLSLLAVGTRLTRESVVQELSKPYVQTARSKGLTERRIIFRHVFRNAMNPVLTMASLQFGYLLAWTILVEAIFIWPGIGLYAYDSFAALDYAPIMALTLVITFAFVLINLVADLIYPLLDPRLRS